MGTRWGKAAERSIIKPSGAIFRLAYPKTLTLAGASEEEGLFGVGPCYSSIRMMIAMLKWE